MSNEAIGGILSWKINGALQRAVGHFTYNLGFNKRDGQKGSAGDFQGYTETPQIAYFEGALTDGKAVKAKNILEMKDKECTLDLANGKTIVYTNGYYAGEGNFNTEKGELGIRVEAESAEEVAAT